MNQADEIIADLQKNANPEQAKHLSKFFKTGPGEYGEGDKFIGLTTPQVREVVKKYKNADLETLSQLLHNVYHDARSTALSILTAQYAKADVARQDEIVKFYINHLQFINNWDLVDISTPKIIGPYCCRMNDYSLIYELADSGHLWSERVAVVANWYVVRFGNQQVIQDLAIKFLNHPHDLMHKAVGWMLRELGKQNEPALLAFLDKYSQQLPRTALRYSIERLTLEQRKHYMQK